MIYNNLFKRLFNKVTLTKIFIIFIVGLFSRGFINYFYGVNVFVEYTNVISLVYYGAMSIFIVSVNEMVEYFGFNIWTPVCNFLFYIFSLLRYFIALCFNLFRYILWGERYFILGGDGSITRKPFDFKQGRFILEKRNGDVSYDPHHRSSGGTGGRSGSGDHGGRRPKRGFLSEFWAGHKHRFQPVHPIARPVEDYSTQYGSQYTRGLDTQSDRASESVRSNTPVEQTTADETNQSVVSRGTVYFSYNPYVHGVPGYNPQDAYNYSDSYSTGYGFVPNAPQMSNLTTPSTMSPLFECNSNINDNHNNNNNNNNNSGVNNQNSGYTSYYYTNPTSYTPASGQYATSYIPTSGQYATSYTTASEQYPASPTSVGQGSSYSGYEYVRYSQLFGRESVATSGNATTYGTVDGPTDPNADLIGLRRNRVLENIRDKQHDLPLSYSSEEIIVPIKSKFGCLKLGFTFLDSFYQSGKTRVEDIYISFEDKSRRILYWTLWERGNDNFNSYKEFKHFWKDNNKVWRDVHKSLGLNIKPMVEELIKHNDPFKRRR